MFRKEPKKRFNALKGKIVGWFDTRSRKWRGNSSFFATIFMVFIVLLAPNKIFMGVLNDAYFNLSLAGKDNLEQTREILAVTNITYDVVGDTLLIGCSLRNDGPLKIQIINLWVRDTTIKKYGYNEAININLEPSDTVVLNGSNVLRVTIKGISSEHILTLWFVTVRGNLVHFGDEQEKLERGGYLKTV